MRSGRIEDGLGFCGINFNLWVGVDVAEGYTGIDQFGDDLRLKKVRYVSKKPRKAQNYKHREKKNRIYLDTIVFVGLVVGPGPLSTAHNHGLICKVSVRPSAETKLGHAVPLGAIHGGQHLVFGEAVNRQSNLLKVHPRPLRRTSMSLYTCMQIKKINEE